LPTRNNPGPDEFNQLQDVTTHAAGVAEPTLLIEPHVKGAVRLAPVVRAIAMQGLPRLRRDPAAEQFTGNFANVQICDLPVVRLDIN
jgi:hypothetical protein